MEEKSKQSIDLSKMPQICESENESDERMQWFRDAKYGMFIHWGPCSVGQKEIGWDRDANCPWDIHKNGPRSEDSIYDNYYKEFNPQSFNADEWVKFAKQSGMKYIVLITKHHDGFSMFDTKLSDYNIMATPYAKDIVGKFVEACHANGIKAGLYYSTRDWYHEDYLVGNNKRYDEWYRAQIDELLSNYGKIDMLWFDHVGGRDWGKWRFDKLFQTIYKNQPQILVNNRAAKFCGPTSPDDLGPQSVELEKIVAGDFYTPEGRIGSMDIEQDWESCIHVGKGWSYRGEDGFKGAEDCIKMLVSCTTGGGNLLLNFGPRPNGTFAAGEVAVAKVVGEWLDKYGEAIYETRGGPYANGLWGGSCFKGNKLYLHLYKTIDDFIAFDALPCKVLSAKTLGGTKVDYMQSVNELKINITKEHLDSPITVVELTLDSELTPGTLVGCTKITEDNISEYGELLSEQIAPEFTSINEEEFELEIPLKRMRFIKALSIETDIDSEAYDTMQIFIANIDKTYSKILETKEIKQKQIIPITHFHAGIDVLGIRSRLMKIIIKGSSLKLLPMKLVQVYGS